MTSLSERARGVIETCDKALTWEGRDLPKVDANTVNAAITILQDAKSQVPNDKLLKAISLGPITQTWTGIRTSMQAVINALPPG
ncbi:MAG: hypothetical protein ABSG27_13745 [Candidatus Acidiferrales bacterium]|jgi:hypothetical protein